MRAEVRRMILENGKVVYIIGFDFGKCSLRLRGHRRKLDMCIQYE